jgi:hypothetical protein
VRSGSLEASAAVKAVVRKDRPQIKRLVDGGESEFAADPPRELTKNLLYYVAHATAAGPRAAEIARLYRLDSLLPTEREVEHAKGLDLGAQPRAARHCVDRDQGRLVAGQGSARYFPARPRLPIRAIWLRKAKCSIVSAIRSACSASAFHAAW